MNSSLNRFVEFMEERENIRLRREAGQSWPWTDDKIFQTYRFTNVHREDDKTTKAFISIYKERPAANPSVALLNCGVFRYFGTVDFANDVGWIERWNPKHVLTVAKTRLASKLPVFTSAYVITNGGLKEPKENVVVRYLHSLWINADSVVADIFLNHKWEDGYKRLSQLPGFGGTGFMAKEVLQDFLLWYEGEIRDRMTFTPMGIGARRGINRVLERPVQFGQLEQKFIDECRSVRYFINDRWPKDWARLSAHDVQFQLCEFDKYERVRLCQGRPKRLYRHEIQNLH